MSLVSVLVGITKAWVSHTLFRRSFMCNCLNLWNSKAFVNLSDIGRYMDVVLVEIRARSS